MVAQPGVLVETLADTEQFEDIRTASGTGVDGLSTFCERRFAHSKRDEAVQEEQTGNPSDHGQPEKCLPAHGIHQESTEWP